MLIEAKGRLTMSPFNYLEAAIRIDRLGSPDKSQKFDELIDALDIEIAHSGREQAHLARQAYQAFGRGRHPAKLNIGDCFAYALSKARGEPLLFKGEDFRRTDIEAAL